MTVAEPEPAARSALFRSMVIYAVLLAADALVVAYAVREGVHGIGYVTVSIVGVVGLLLAYQVWQHLRDLGSPLAETEGVVLRKWQRADLVIAWQSFYIQIGRAIFKVQPLDYHLLESEMYVKIVHFPRTLNVVSVHEIPGGMPPPADAGL
ncbi:MAG: hypothetical protein HY873_00610 [Chloroflexi bacterium]|nr:hypothetical protein [Chloroflexota bacterium]